MEPVSDNAPTGGIVGPDATYMHREIHRLGSATGQTIEITPWEPGRYRMHEDGFVRVWLERPYHAGFVMLCGAYEDRFGRYVRICHEFAPANKEPANG